MNIDELKRDVLKLSLVDWKSPVAVELPDGTQYAATSTRWDVQSQSLIIIAE